jgi:hypothetical protein
MKARAITTALLFVPVSIFAQAKPCDELKADIAKKLNAKGVPSYSLDIVAKDTDQGDAKVVGTCEGGMKKILYARGSDSAPKPATDPSKP